MRRVGVMLGLVAGLQGLWGVAARGDGAPEQDAPLCVAEIRARGGDEIAALRAAEAERWRIARRAARAGRQTLSDHLATSPSGAPALIGQMDRAGDAYSLAVQEANALCRCRLRRGDAQPSDCERRYPVW